MQWENSGFVNIGSLCSLAQQSLLCIKHLRTEVLNNIFIFPVDVSSLFWDNSVVLVLLSNLIVLAPSEMVRMLPTRNLELYCVVVRSGCLPPGTFLLGLSRLQ